MNKWIRAGVSVIGVAGCAFAVLAQDARAPVLQAPASPARVLDSSATVAPGTWRGNAQPPQPQPPQWRAGSNASAASNQTATTAVLPIEQRVAVLEAALVKATARIAELETRMRTHTHSVSRLSVGMLVEKLNGRDVSLAISPRWDTGTTGPAQP